jgi:hypothetical protein
MGLKVLSDLVVGALTFPSTDGSAGQVLKTDGSGNLSFATVSTADTKLDALSFNTGSGVLTATMNSGSTVTVDLDGRYAAASHTHAYDNYQFWNLKTNGVQRTTVQSGGTLDLKAGSNVTLSYGAGGVVTISSTDTNTDTNYYVDALSFNTTNGILTVGRNGGLADLTVDLDGRYLTSVTAHTHAIGDIIDLETNLNKTLMNATVSNDTITFTRGDGTTFNITTSDANTNNYADSVAFNTTTGVLTIGRNGSLADLTVDLDGRYLTGVPAEYLTQTEGDTLYQPVGNYQAAGTYNTIIGTDSDINTSGSTIIDNIYVTDGVITSMGTRTLTLGDLGYSGATDADNYGSWTISDSINSEAIRSGDTLTVRGSGATTVTYDAGANLLIIDSTDTNTDTNTNYYLSGASFNTGDGVLTLTVTGAANQTVDLDGRYALSSHSHSYLPLAGGTMTGNIAFRDSGEGLTWDMNTDAAYIKFFNTGDGDTNSRLEYSTADNGNEFHRWMIATIEEMTLKSDGLRVTNDIWAGGNKVATESYVSTAISNLVDSAPGTLNTLNELAAALGDDPNFATTVSEAIGRKLDASANPIVSATVSNDTTTFVKADGTSFALTTNDANSNTYVTGASFNTSDGVLTLTRNSGSVTVDLDGRYLQSLPAHTHPIAEVDGLSAELNKVIYNATVSNDTITFTRGDGTTFNVTTSDANTNYYLNGISKSGNTLTFSVSGATNQTYTFGSNAFTSYTDHSAAGYLAAASYTAADVLDKIKTVDGAGSGLDADTLDGLSSGSFFRSDAGNGVDVRFAAGNGRGVRFWDSDAYKIWMSATTDGTWGGRLDSTSDYNLYFKIGGGTNRGFVFRNDADPVAQIDSKGVIYTATTGNSTNWKDAYDNYITGISVSGTSTKTITLTQRDGGTISTTFTDIDTDTNTWRPIDDTPRDGQTGVSISSNWAFDNVKTAVPANAKFTDTTYSVGDGGLTEKNFTSALKTKLDGIAASANNYSHPGYTARSINTSGAAVLDVFTSDTAGHVTNITTRNLTLGDLGYTGATNANYITKVSQLTNDSGYLTSTNDRVYLTDSRGGFRLPSYYNDRYAQWDFQNQSDTGAGGDGWHGVLTVAKWSSFDPSHRQEQLIFTGDNLKRRAAISDSEWGEVKTIWDTGNLNPIVSATVSNDTTTYTKADGSTFALTTSDANSNTYVTGASFNTTNGVLTLTRNSGSVTVDLDGRYLQSLPGHTHPIDQVDGLSAELGKVIYNATVSNDTITFTRGDGSTFTVTTSDADTDTWRPIHDSPVNGATTTSISSNWAFDNVKTAVPAGAVFTDTNTTYSAGSGLSLSGTTFSHADTSSLNGAYGGNNNGVVIEDITVDSNGHITAIGTRDLDGRFAPASHSHSYDLYDYWSVADAGGTAQFNVGSRGAVKFRGSGATNIVFDAANNTIIVDSTDTNTDTNTTYSADGNYGITLSGTTFRLEDDRRRNSTSVDIYSGNTHDFTWYDADVGIRWYTAGAEEMRLQNDGTLHVDGDVVAYSTTVSDKRLKDNVVTIDNALDKIKKLRGVEYVWNAGYRKGKKDLGLIAQEVEEVLPEIVHEHEMPLMEDGVEGEVYKTVDYEKMVGVLIEAMKEQQTQIDSLKAEVALLKQK